MIKGLKYIVFLVFISTGVCFAGKVKRAFHSLEIYDYFDAKKLFEKSLKKHPVPANFGLSIIYARNDNPFSNLDSAHIKILKSYESLEITNDKTLDKYTKFGVDSLAIVKQRNVISDLYYFRAVEVNSIYGFQDFIEKNAWSTYIDSAIYYRDFLAFEAAVQSGKSSDYSSFLETYPGSEFVHQATDRFHESVYVEQTHTNNFIDYVNFVKANPESPFRPDAEDKIYSLATETGTAEAFKNFIIEYPTNKNIKIAWKHLFNARMQEKYSAENISAFGVEFPNYPFKKELELELSMANKKFYPVKHQKGWGYCDKNGNLLIDFKFEGVEWFSEGLAVFKKDKKFGYINKLGQISIPAIFDDALAFNEGYALVEMDELWGMIDRNGEFIIPATYEDLGKMREGLAFFQEGEYFGYFDNKGRVRLQAQFSEAFDFKNGLAVVSKNDYYGLIDPFGTTYIPFKYEGLSYFKPGVYAAKHKDYWGLINLSGDTLLNFEYDFIGLPIEGISIVEKDEEFNFLNSQNKFLFQDWMDTYSEYRQLAAFKNGFAKIEFNKGFNLSDTLGKKLLHRDYEDVGHYSNLIAVKKANKWGYVNKSGQTIIEHKFEYAQSFNRNEAIIRMDPFYGLIDAKGNYIIGPYQEELNFINDSVLVAKSMGKYGLISIEGDTLLNYKYLNIEPIDASVVKIEENNEVYYYNFQTKHFIRKEQ